MPYPTEKDYIKLSTRYNLIPVSSEWPMDTETPITIYNKLASSSLSYLLESVEGGEKLARYSFIGFDPFLSYHQQGNTGQITEYTGALNSTSLPEGRSNGKNQPCNLRQVTGNPFDILESILKRFNAPPSPGLPRFYGGAVGYLGYDLVRWLEKIPLLTRNDLNFPDCFFIFTRVLLIFDHVRRSLIIVINTQPGSNPRHIYYQALKQIEEILTKLSQNSLAGALNLTSLQIKNSLIEPLIKANISRQDFQLKVTKAKEYIRQGDILQVVPSRRFKVPLKIDPFQAYRRLRTINPSPYLYFLNFGELTIAGSSPEMLVRVEGSEVETRPIAGTRPRGATKEEDIILAQELLADPKERAEHIMLVDLGRNDLGRVCMPGSVTVPQFMITEKYSHVMHLVSSVQGILPEGCSVFEPLKACFPAGTVSGAPKIRAMEIIEELEPTRRGPYAGAIGYFGFNGNLDTAITIRTIIFNQNTAYVQTGGGVVADSVPEREYQETVNKAQALLKTLGVKVNEEELPCS
ncbi:MAG: anthranilate synthase component I [Peptococcaceae bacterium]